MRILNAIGLAVQFLTRLPVPRSVRYSPEALALSVVFYPLVGLLVGALLLLLRWLLGEAGPLLSAALVLTAWAGITGGLHLDGLADCADAWAGGQGDREKSLRIMKDPCSGPIAVATVVLLLLVKFAALAELSGQGLVLLWVPVLGRTAVPLLLLTTPYVRPGGLGSPLVENLPRLTACLAAFLSLLCVAFFLGIWPVLAGLLVASGLRHLVIQRLGGCTGDTLGAAIEIIEATVLAVSVLA